MPSRRDLSADLPVDFSALAREELLHEVRYYAERGQGLRFIAAVVEALERPVLVSEGWKEPLAQARADKALSVRTRLRRQSVSSRGAARDRCGPRLAAPRLLAAARPASNALRAACHRTVARRRAHERQRNPELNLTCARSPTVPDIGPRAQTVEIPRTGLWHVDRK